MQKIETKKKKERIKKERQQQKERKKERKKSGIIWRYDCEDILSTHTFVVSVL